MEIKDVLKLKIEKDEVLVIQYDPSIMEEDTIRDSAKVIKDVFPENKVLFVPDNMDLTVVSIKELYP